MSDLWRRSANQLAAMIARREATATETVEAHLARIQAVNSEVNAVVRVLADEARAAAEAADRHAARGDALGVLHGVPFTVKENIDMAGLPTTWGLPALAHAVVPADAPVVERMRAAGAIAIARTNLPDMALRLHTHSSLHGLTRNPWNVRRTAGGSSGGDAAALATGMTPIGLGNDIGGSLRNPANACGIVSLRPSAGRVPDAGFVPNPDFPLAVQLMQVQGPMARTVADVRRVLGVLAGSHPRDPWSVDVPLAGAPVARPIRVAVVAEPPGLATASVVAEAVRRAAEALSDAGYEIVDACPPRYGDACDAWAALLLGDFDAFIEDLLPLMGPEGRMFIDRVRASVSPPSAKAMSQLLAMRHGIAREWSQFLAGTPLVLSPTWTQLPFEHGFDVATEEGTAAVMTMMRPVVPANLMGLPSACVPAGRDAATGLPIGVLLTGGRYRDDLCLDAAAAIEARVPLATPIDPAG